MSPGCLSEPFLKNGLQKIEIFWPFWSFLECRTINTIKFEVFGRFWESMSEIYFSIKKTQIWPRGRTSHPYGSSSQLYVDVHIVWYARSFTGPSLFWHFRKFTGGHKCPKSQKPSQFKGEISKNRKNPQNLNAFQNFFEFTGGTGGTGVHPKTALDRALPGPNNFNRLLSSFELLVKPTGSTYCMLCVE